MRLRMLVTCEHGGNRVPRTYARLFEGASEALGSHRGWDPGALALARRLARGLDAPLRYSLVTRLLVDLNRTLENSTLFSEFTESLSDRQRRRLVSLYHRRYWRRVIDLVEPWVRHGDRVLHVGAHSFTPAWEGRSREVDVGILFDPTRSHEERLARAWISELERRVPRLRVRANEPYQGANDGLTTGLRGRFPGDRYLGIELEVTQDLTRRASRERRETYDQIVEALLFALALEL